MNNYLLMKFDDGNEFYIDVKKIAECMITKAYRDSHDLNFVKEFVFSQMSWEDLVDAGLTQLHTIIQQEKMYPMYCSDWTNNLKEKGMSFTNGTKK